MLAQVRAMLAVLDRRWPGAARRLRPHPIVEMASWPEIRLRLVDEHIGSRGCAVSGSYHPELTPPTLLVGRSLSHRRRAFTALHELGHHLQQTDVDLGERTFEASNPLRFQEKACDAFAAEVLLPDAELARPGLTARDIVAAYESSAASREACCVWASRHIRGTVALLDASGTVLFASGRGISGSPLVRAALRSRGPVSDSTGDAAWCDGYLIAVLRVGSSA
ncbi:ImmA/IrrE family metallo-endopeptidase [Allokutzneria sp. A3M-2-11 16]|uniref:ImmA/IrrE family metallo-endopeptidase n=1 Tax=Allokutzneria sp. A3M-2-11 16 TaxID=2962043 RepID=UPI0020B77DE5|nr:ImmA/IrrE family metallo-endopeptidase [Allokutzneria sp. A3M-2-11 16]MCP3804883.1 ImmA/IrrE family metallo-endopeptidase [Allokutzneria sp. A3M-2-11 16]